MWADASAAQATVRSVVASIVGESLDVCGSIGTDLEANCPPVRSGGSFVLFAVRWESGEGGAPLGVTVSRRSVLVGRVSGRAIDYQGGILGTSKHGDGGTAAGAIFQVDVESRSPGDAIRGETEQKNVTEKAPGRREGHIWRRRPLQPFPSLLQPPPGPVTRDQILHLPPRARSSGTARHHGTLPPHADCADPISAAVWQHDAVRAARPLRAGQTGCRGESCACRCTQVPPVPCHPGAAVANGRPNLDAWLRASRCAGAGLQVRHLASALSNPPASRPMEA